MNWRMKVKLYMRTKSMSEQEATALVMDEMNQQILDMDHKLSRCFQLMTVEQIEEVFK